MFAANTVELFLKLEIIDTEQFRDNTGEKFSALYTRVFKRFSIRIIEAFYFFADYAVNIFRNFEIRLGKLEGPMPILLNNIAAFNEKVDEARSKQRMTFGLEVDEFG